MPRSIATSSAARSTPVWPPLMIFMRRQCRTEPPPYPTPLAGEGREGAQSLRNRAFNAPMCRRSEIRLVRPRHRGVPSGQRQFQRVLGTDNFPPCFGAAPVGYGRRPGHGEDAFIFDRELELQVLAPVAVVGSRACIGAARRAPILPCVPFQSFSRGFVI